jgi:hypothetical protein
MHRRYDWSSWICTDQVTYVHRAAAPLSVALGVCPACFQRRLRLMAVRPIMQRSC